jgi:YbbR domain-containing protein
VSTTRRSPPRPWWQLLGDLLFRHWGTKVLALLLAMVLFVVTRDEVTRAFEVPLRVTEDPDRVLMTSLPSTITVQVRGPWTRVNRLQDYDFGSASLDLRSSTPGPLQIDAAAIVMPRGVILAGIQYDHVDLRFDRVIERDVTISPVVQGHVAADYELSRVECTPERWTVRGGQSAVQALAELSTEPFDLDEATTDVTATLAIVRPEGTVRLVPAEGASVKVHAVVRVIEDTRTYTVPVSVGEATDPTGVVPDSYTVVVQGPRPELRRLDELAIGFPVEATAEVVEGHPPGPGVVEVRFGWSERVPPPTRASLRIDHGIERVNLPAPPAPEPVEPTPVPPA